MKEISLSYKYALHIGYKVFLQTYIRNHINFSELSQSDVSTVDFIFSFITYSVRIKMCKS